MKKAHLVIMLMLAVIVLSGCRVVGNRVYFKDPMPKLALGEYTLTEELLDTGEAAYTFVFEIINTGSKGRLRIETDFQTGLGVEPIIGEIDQGTTPVSIEAVSPQPIAGVPLKVYAISQDSKKEELQIDVFIEKQ